MSAVVLGIDTSSSWCSAALVRGDEVFARRAEVGNAHSDHLLAMIASVLTEARTSLDRCDALAYSAGPGSFTGLRVGCAVAQGLAFGASLPVASIGTLDAIARSVVGDDDARGAMLIAQDARMGELYWALFDHDGARAVPVTGSALATPSGLRTALASIDRSRPYRLGGGNAWSVHREALQGLVERVVPRASADAVDIAALGVVACCEGQLVAPEHASPLYVRDEVARTTAELRADALRRVA